MRALRAVLAVAMVLALTASAGAQMGTSMMSGKDVERREAGAPPPREKPTKRANEKDYKSSLERLPDQKFDPWAKTR